MRDAVIRDSLIADGCQIGAGTVIENSIIGLRSVIGENVTIKNSIIMGADYYAGSVKAGDEPGQVPLGIGNGSSIQGTIVDKNCRIGRNVKIDVSPEAADTDVLHPQFVVRDGVAIVVKDANLPDGWELLR